MAQIDFPKREEELIEFWEQNKVFEKSVNKPAPKGDFVFYDGPPFATGLPHYGHILASTIKDVIPRYKTMRGYKVRRRWGWDCHGLPIENIVEQQLGISGKKQIEERGIDEFNRTCREGVLKYAKEWGKMVRRIARWIEFDNSYKTMDSAYTESVWWALKQAWDKNLIYQGQKVLLWCPRCETPISNFEVAMDNSYQDIKDTSVVVKFKVKQGKFKNAYLLAWTTTPWSLFTTMGLAVGKDFDYVRIHYKDEDLIMAKDRLGSVMEGLVDYKIIDELKGKDLIGVEYEHLFNYFYNHPEVKNNKKVYHIYPADYVSTEEGTGIVTINGSYGEVDFESAQTYKLPVVLDINEQGFIKNEVKDFAGKYALEENENIIQYFKEKGLLLRSDLYEHSYPFCWRCETKLMYRAIPAWFIKIQKIKKKLLKLNEKISWYPGHLKHGRFQNIVEGAPDWNISRNRYWASPLPFWKCGCGEVVCIGSFEELQKQAVNYDQVYQSRELKSVDLHRPYIDKIKIKCKKCSKEMERIPEVVDCWVESASMPFAEFHYPFENKKLFESRYPADFVAEYIAQTRTWFYYMHVIGVLLFGKPPFKHVVSTGTILNEKGEKLSKSKRNYPEPWEIIGKYGVDALRYYLMTSVVMQADNLFFAEREVDEAYKKIVLLTLNVLSFYKLYENKEVANKIPASKHVLDKWIIARLHETIRTMTEAMDKYDMVNAGRLLPEFINDLSTWYLRRSRERFKSSKKRDRDAALRTTSYVLRVLSQLMAPIMPFLAEHVYKEIAKGESVHLEQWPKAKKAKINNELLEQMRSVRKVVELAHAARDEAGIKVRQPLADLKIQEHKNIKIGNEFLKLIKEEVNVKKVAIEDRPLPQGEGQGEGQWVVKEEKDIKVALNTQINSELKKEGLLRELTRILNDARKKTGLTPSDIIDVYLATDNTVVAEVVREYKKQLRKAVIAKKIQIVKRKKKGLDWSGEINIGGQGMIWVGILR